MRFSRSNRHVASRARSQRSPPPTTASSLLALCNMKTLYLRNVPESVMDRLKRLAEVEGTSVNAVAVRELTLLSRRIDNPNLLAALSIGRASRRQSGALR